MTESENNTCKAVGVPLASQPRVSSQLAKFIKQCAMPGHTLRLPRSPGSTRAGQSPTKSNLAARRASYPTFFFVGTQSLVMDALFHKAGGNGGLGYGRPGATTRVPRYSFFRRVSITRDACAIPQGRLYSTRLPLFHKAAFIPQGRLYSTRQSHLHKHPMSMVFASTKLY